MAKQRIAVVTGGMGGLGETISTKMAEAGYRVVVTYSPANTKYKAWLEDVLNGPSPYGIAPQVLASVVRICTHARIFRDPSTTLEAFEFCRVLLEQPNATVVTPGEHHWFEERSDQAAVLEQDGWLFEYRFSVELSDRLPSRIHATSGDTRVRILIDRWSFDR